MSSRSAKSVETNKARPATGRRLIIAVVVLLIVALIVLVAGVVFMQKEIRTTKSTLEGLKTLEDDVSESQHKAQSSVQSESRITLGQQTKGKRVRLSRSQKVNCEQITIPFCQNMPYTMGQFPNLLNHQTQDEAKTSKFRLLIESGCSPDIAPLVCSVLAPPCNGTRKPVVPCKELCKRATKNCKAQLKKFGIRLDSSMRCRFLPKESTSKCFNGSWPKNTPANGCNKVSSDQCTDYIKRIPPWTVQFPNYFGHMTARQARAGFYRFSIISSLASKECSSILKYFLCHLYFPSCTSSRTRLPPCRELCQETRTKCKREIKHVSNNFTWPSDVRCKNFPKQGTSPCYMGPATEVAATRSPQLEGKCQVITIPICKSIPYNMTEFPNFFRHESQEEAALEVQQFWPLVQVNCSSELAFFLCSLYAPLCSTLDSPPPPCRRLCSRVKSGCLPILVKYGYAWPDSMACETFPEGLGDEVCLDRPSPKVVTVATQPPLRTEATGEGTCDALTIPLCSNLPYNMTRFPNFLKHDTQQQAALEVHQFFPLVKVGCSPDFQQFLCSVYAPPCKGPQKPCRELCNRARRGCIKLMNRFGFTWPMGLACDKFPPSANGTKCFDA